MSDDQIVSAYRAHPNPAVPTLHRYHDNGTIICADARAHCSTPVARGHPVYAHMRDFGGDRVVCEG